MSQSSGHFNHPVRPTQIDLAMGNGGYDEEKTVIPLLPSHSKMRASSLPKAPDLPSSQIRRKKKTPNTLTTGNTFSERQTSHITEETESCVIWDLMQ